MSTLSILPAHYDLEFIIKGANVINHFGYEMKADGIHFRYQVDDYDAVQSVIASYRTTYCAVMAPRLIDFVSKTREAKLAAFQFNGMTIPLDLVTSANLTGSAVGLTRDQNRLSVNWSLGKGQFVTIPRKAMLALADAAFAFVNDCFDAQKIIVEQIKAAADIEELRLIDIAGHEAWPV